MQRRPEDSFVVITFYKSDDANDCAEHEYWRHTPFSAVPLNGRLN